jgi:outer membrane receptor for Fe3+-dicitrate
MLSDLSPLHIILQVYLMSKSWHATSLSLLTNFWTLQCTGKDQIHRGTSTSYVQAYKDQYRASSPLNISSRLLQANYAQNSVHHLEMAVKDAKQAVSHAPGDLNMKQQYQTWRRELSSQNAKDRASFGSLFSRGNLYPDKVDSPPNPGPPSVRPTLFALRTRVPLLY